MPTSTALPAAAEALRTAATPIANEFVRRHACASESGAADRLAPVEMFDLAVAVVRLCVNALGAGETTGLPAGRGSRVALQGKSIAEAVDWLRSLERVITDHVLADCVLERDETRAALARVGELFDGLCTQELESFTSTYDELSRWQSRVGTDLLSCLVAGSPIDTATVNNHARVLNINPHQSFRAVVAYHEPLPSPQQWARVRRRILETLWRRDPRREALLRDRTGLLLALVPANREGPGLVEQLGKLLDEELGRSLFLAVGEPGSSLGTAGHSCRQALSAMEIAIYRGQRGRVIQCTEVILEVLLAHNRWVSRRIVDTRIGALVEKPHLLDTLRVYIACDMALQRTAEELVVHPNTVAYRLRQIAALTGRDMRRITDIGDLSVALTAYDAMQMRRDQEEGRTDLRARLFG